MRLSCLAESLDELRYRQHSMQLAVSVQHRLLEHRSVDFDRLQVRYLIGHSSVVDKVLLVT